MVTSRERTILDCLRTGSADEALAVADSALREGESSQWLRSIAARAQGPHARRVRAAVSEASPLAANPFESVLRWLALQVPGLQVRPQVSLYARGRILGRPDLVDEELGIVIEADSFAWHGQRDQLVRDARRYKDLVVAGCRRT